MNGRLDRIPERVYEHISANPGADIRTMCRDIRGRLRQNDIQYLQSVIRIMQGKGIIVPEGKGWKVAPEVDFMQRYYAEGKMVDPSEIMDYLVQMRGSTSSQIDKALGYDAIRGSYPILIAMERRGEVTREKEEHGNSVVWVWHPSDPGSGASD